MVALSPAMVSYQNPPDYLFRGQADAAWPLEPSLLRRLRGLTGRKQHLGIEAWLTEEFLAQAALFPETNSVWAQLHHARSVDRWAYMQHHGCVTRLLDWTASAYVAAYFAVYQFPDKAGALFIVAPGPIHTYGRQNEGLPEELNDEHLLSDSVPDRVFFCFPQFRPLRAVTQQGNFSAALDLRMPHDSYMLRACSHMQKEFSNRVLYRKIVIPTELKPVILQQLFAMNITPHALFPGLDGLGRSLSDQASLKAILVGNSN